MTAPKRRTVPRRLNAASAPSMFPHTVTVYNTATETGGDFNERQVNHITLLRGVLLAASDAVNVHASGLEGADVAVLYIPFGVEAVDGVTGERKRYVPSAGFWRTEDKSGLWTLSSGGNTFFVKGEVVEPGADVERIEMKYDGVYTVTKVETKDFGELKHWEVGGN